MGKVYIVSKRRYRRYANCEPYISEITLKVFGSIRGVISYIAEQIKGDHMRIDSGYYDPRNWTKYYPKREEWKCGYYIKSVEFDDGYSYDSTCYRFVPYDVE